MVLGLKIIGVTYYFLWSINSTICKSADKSKRVKNTLKWDPSSWPCHWSKLQIRSEIVLKRSRMKIDWLILSTIDKSWKSDYYMVCCITWLTLVYFYDNKNSYFNRYWCSYWFVTFKKFFISKNFDNNYGRLKCWKV